MSVSAASSTASSLADGEVPATVTEAEVLGPKVFVAGFFHRLIAGVVDALILTPILLFVGWLTVKVTGAQVPPLSELRVESALELVLEGGSLLASLLAMGTVILVLYGSLFIATTGATPGLRLLRLRVINVYGEAPEWWRGILRCLGEVVAALLLGLGLLWIGFDREKRGLHDWLAGTYVIRNRTGGEADQASEA
jgi:uncharacterized RDD family membrane protein YckC